MKQTLDLQRASDAWTKVEEIGKNYNTDWGDQYASYVESLPATVLSCGLGQAAAILLAAAKKSDMEQDPHYVLYRHLQDWLCRDDTAAPYRREGDLLKAIISRDRQTYMRAQVETLAWLEWLKELAVAYLKKRKTGDKK